MNHTIPKINKVVTVPKPRVLEIVDRPFPKQKPGTGCVIVKQEIAALCNEDQMWVDHTHEWFAHPVYGMGHESAGTVVDAGTSRKLKPGDRVLISHGAWCGRCYACRNLQNQAMCAGGTGEDKIGGSNEGIEFYIDGLAPIERINNSESGWAALAEYKVVEEGICTILPDDLDFRYAIAGECSLGAVYSAQEYMDVKPGDYLMILGNGQRQFSLSQVVVSLYRGARVIAVVRDDYQADRVRAIGRARGGNPDLHIVDMRKEDWKDKVLQLTDGVGPEKAVDVTCEEEVLNAALALMAPMGCLYIHENLYKKPEERRLNIDPYTGLAEKNLRVMSTIDSLHTDRPGQIRMLRNKEVQAMWDEVATHTFAMAEVDKALDLLATKECGKILIDLNR